MFGHSCFDCCKRTKNHAAFLEKTEEKFIDELEVKNLLRKVRDSYDMTKNMINKTTRGLL
jgi:hypothetical protein